MSPPARSEDIIDLYDDIIINHVENGDLKSDDVRGKFHDFLNMLAFSDIERTDVVEIGQEFVDSYKNAPAESATPQLFTRSIAKIFGGIGLAITLTKSFESRFRLENGDTRIAWDLEWKKQQINQKTPAPASADNDA